VVEREIPGSFDPQAVARFRDRMDDDLDTPGAVAGIFDLVRQANAAADAGDEAPGRRAAETVGLLAAALGLGLRGEVDEQIDPASAKLVRRRDEARGQRDWAQADRLRDELTDAGWVVEDGADGTRIRRP
jgi:cysteinyl-tRNA synthetase